MAIRLIVGMVGALSVLACKDQPAPQSTTVDSAQTAIAPEPIRPDPTPLPDPEFGSPSEPPVPLDNHATCRAAASAERPNVVWAPHGYIADLTYDGAADMVTWGTEGDTLFVVSIVGCADGQAGRVSSLPIPRDMYGTVRLGVSLVNPAFGEGYLDENCMGAEDTPDCRRLAVLNARLQEAFEHGGRGLIIGLPDRDHVHLYWDSDTNQFVTWRL